LTADRRFRGKAEVHDVWLRPPRFVDDANET